MRNRKKVFIAIGATLVFMALAGVSAFLRFGQPQVTVKEAETTTAVDLGFSYVNINPRLASYYGFKVSSGAMVTEVTAGSPAAQAGIKPGDIIYSFNSEQVESDTPLFGMMQACPKGNRIVLELSRGDSTQVIELMHIE